MTRIHLRRSFAILALPLALLACSHPQKAADRIYVSNEHGDTISVVDPTKRTVVDTIAVGKRPRGLALSPDGTTLYVAISGSPIGGPGVDESKLPPPDRNADGIAVIDTATGKRLRVLQAGADPETFVLSPDGRLAFVSNEDTGEVSSVSVDGSRKTLVQHVGEQPEGVAITPDGATLFVACEASDHVMMLDARTLKPIRTIAIAGRPRGALMARDGGAAYISVENAGQIAMVSTSDGRIVRTIDLAKGDRSIRPMGLAEGPDGHLFVTTGRAGKLIEIDPAAGRILRTTDRIGARPWGIGLSRDGATLLTANGPSNDITLIDRVTLNPVAHIAAGKGPWGIATDAGGAR